MLHNNLLATILTFAAALLWLQLNQAAARRGWVSGPISRKIIHIGTGPIFVLCWLLFEDTPSAPYLAALVPFSVTVQYAFVGLGWLENPAAVQAMTRTGDRRELLRGPLFYGLIFTALTILYWKSTPAGIAGLMILCSGDGLADLTGRRWGRRRLPWSPRKSWIGSLTVFLAGGGLALAVIAVYVAAGVFPAPLAAYGVPLLASALAATLVESLPFPDVDNLTIPLAVLLVWQVFS